MIINADHANHMLALTLVIDDQYVIIECMEFKEVAIAERRMFQHMIMPAGLFHFALLRQLAYRLAYGANDEGKLFMRIFRFQRYCRAPEIRRRLDIPHPTAPLLRQSDQVRQERLRE